MIFNSRLYLRKPEIIFRPVLGQWSAFLKQAKLATALFLSIYQTFQMRLDFTDSCFYDMRLFSCLTNC